MSSENLFVQIPDHLTKIIGEPEPGTRLYRAYGTNEDMGAWISAVTEICGSDGNLSPGGVSGFVKVSRSAVHKRIRDGKLSSFCFYTFEDSGLLMKFLRSKKLTERGRPDICDIPVTELHAWKAEVARKSVAKRRKEEAKISAKEGSDKIINAPRNWDKNIKK